MLRKDALLNLRLSSAQRPQVREGCVGLELAEEMLICDRSHFQRPVRQTERLIPAAVAVERAGRRAALQLWAYRLYVLYPHMVYAARGVLASRACKGEGSTAKAHARCMATAANDRSPTGGCRPSNTSHHLVSQFAKAGSASPV
jgi:hypothetical protein